MRYAYWVIQTEMDCFIAALSQIRISVWYALDDRERIIDYGRSLLSHMIRHH